MSVPAVLDDNYFIAYGGMTGTSTAAQRSAAYLVAEESAERAIGTFVVPTDVTGTFPWPLAGKALVLPHHHILGIYSAVPRAIGCDTSCDLIAGEACTYQQDDGGWGYLFLRDISYIYNGCCVGVAPDTPFNVEITYRAGLTSGSYLSPSFLLGLTKVAQVVLNEIVDPGANEGGEGDPGVQSWTTAGHTEIRKALANTALGNSAVANFANRLFGKFKPKRCLKLGW